MNGKTLKWLRLYNRLTQSDVAIKTGLSETLISEVENGKRKVSQKTLDAYAKYFDVEKYQLLYMSESIDRKGKLPAISEMIMGVIKFGADRAEKIENDLPDIGDEDLKINSDIRTNNSYA